MKLTMNLLTLACASVLLSGASWAAHIDTLRTHTGQQVGITISHYKYEEPNFMSLEAMKLGIDYSSTLTVDDSWFIRLDGRYATGDADYESAGTGSSDDIPDWYAEIRALDRDRDRLRADLHAAQRHLDRLLDETGSRP